MRAAGRVAGYALALVFAAAFARAGWTLAGYLLGVGP